MSPTTPASSTSTTIVPKIQSNLLSELPLHSDTLMFGLNYKYTLLDKGGLINRIKGNKQAIDIDLSCVLFDKTLKVVDMIWFKQLRDASEAIRHRGDSLDGRDRGDAAQIDSSVDVETIELRLSKLPLKVSHLVLLISSYHSYPLKSVERGHLYISDDEGNDVFTLDLTKLNNDSSAIGVASLTRELDEWRLSLINLPLTNSTMTEMVSQVQKELARSHTISVI